MATINFDDKIFAQDILNQVIKYLAPLNAFARDFTSETEKVGNAVSVPLIGACTATTFTQGPTVYEQTHASGTISAVTVTLDENHLVPVNITDLQALNHSPARAEVFAVQAASALANRVFSRIASLVLSTNFGAIVTTLTIASWNLTTIRKLKLKLEQRDAAKGMRSLFIPVELEDILLGDPQIAAAYAYGNAEAIQNGTVPKLLGFDLYAINNLPTNAISLYAWVQHRDAIAVAMRLKKPQAPDDLLAYEELVDPRTGFSFSYRRHYSRGSGQHHINLEALFGMAAAITLNLALGTTLD